MKNQKMLNRISKNKILNLFRKKRSSLYKEQLSPFNSFEEKEERAKYSYRNDNNGYFSERNRYFARKTKLDENLPLSYRGSRVDHNKIYGHSHPPISIKYAHQKNMLNKGKNLYSFRGDDYSNNNNDFKSIDFDDENLSKNTNNKDANFNINENNKIIYQNNNQEINEDENPTLINGKDYNINNDDNFDFDDDNTNNKNYIKLNYNYYSDFGSPITIINNHENNYNLNNLLKKEYLPSIQNQNMNKKNYNNVNESVHENSLSFNIKDNEILNSPIESISNTPISNLVNINNNRISSIESNKDNFFDNKENYNYNFNDNNLRINEYNDKSNLNKLYYDYNFLKEYDDIYKNNNNNYSYNKQKEIIFKENNENNINYNNYSNSSTNNKANDPKIINKKNYSTITPKLIVRNNTPINYKLNNFYSLKKSKTINTFHNKNSIKSNYFDEANEKNNSSNPDKYLFKSIFDYNSTKNFVKTFSPKSNKVRFTNFYYDKAYKTNLKLTRHNIFGLKKDQNLLGQLLQKIIKHKKENKHSISNHTLYKFYKDKNEKNINKIIENFLNSSKIKYNKSDNKTVLPPNQFNFKGLK